MRPPHGRNPPTFRRWPAPIRTTARREGQESFPASEGYPEGSPMFLSDRFSRIGRALAPASFSAVFAVTAALADPAEPDIKRIAKPVVEVAFVLDTTGSMGPLIEGA